MNTDKLKALAEAATTGPWHNDQGSSSVHIYSNLGHAYYVADLSGCKSAVSNAAYIAAANPAVVLELIRQRDDLASGLEDYKRLVRELDVLINGEDGAARQASLCDLVAQLKVQRAGSWPNTVGVKVSQEQAEAFATAFELTATIGGREVTMVAKDLLIKAKRDSNYYRNMATSLANGINLDGIVEQLRNIRKKHRQALTVKSIATKLIEQLTGGTQ